MLLATWLMSEYLTAIAVAAQLHRTTYEQKVFPGRLTLVRAAAARNVSHTVSVIAYARESQESGIIRTVKT